MIQFRTPELARDAARLGLTPATFQPCVHNAEARQALLRDVRKRFHALALECHPDRHPDKADEFKSLSAAMTEVEAFLTKFQPAPPIPFRPHPFFNGGCPFPFAQHGSSSATTTTSYGFGGTVFTVIFSR